MTIENRIVFDLAEIKAVVFECCTCVATASLPIGKADQPPSQCPTGHRWDWNVNTGYQSTESPFRAFLASLDKMIDLRCIQLGFRIWLELKPSDSQTSKG